MLGPRRVRHLVPLLAIVLVQAACVERWYAAPATDPGLVESAAEESACGEPRAVDGYAVDHRGERYTLPRYVEITRSGARLFADPSARAWLAPYLGVEHARFGEQLVLRTFERDCVELDRVRFFLISPDGSVLHQEAWTGNWRAGLFVHEGRLAYWSEWFCSEANDERGPDTSYLYVLSEREREFRRVSVEASRYCPEGDGIRFLEFEPALPLSGGRH